jgi:hypothetical protein
MFEHLNTAAVYGKPARAIIKTVIDELDIRN